MKAVCLTHVPTNGGTVNDAARVAKVVHEVSGRVEDGGPLIMLDACQSVGQLDVSVKELQCDIMAATSVSPQYWLLY